MCMKRQWRYGRPPIDPVVMVKYLMLVFLYGIPSERQLEARCADGWRCMRVVAAAAVIFVVAVLYQAQKTGLTSGESVERRHQRIRDAAMLPVYPNLGHGESCYCGKQKGNDNLVIL